MSRPRTVRGMARGCETGMQAAVSRNITVVVCVESRSWAIG